MPGQPYTVTSLIRDGIYKSIYIMLSLKINIDVCMSSYM